MICYWLPEKPAVAAAADHVVARRPAHPVGVGVGGVAVSEPLLPAPGARPSLALSVGVVPELPVHGRYRKIHLSTQKKISAPTRLATTEPRQPLILDVKNHSMGVEACHLAA